MKKLFLIFFIIFLTIFTTVTKNSTKKLESQIYSAKEKISILKNKYELELLEYNYLTTPKKLIEYQSKYFEKNLIPLDITKIKKIKEIMKNPQTHLNFYDQKEKIQLRIQTTSEINFNNHVTSEAWKKTKLSSRKCYLTKKTPSSFTDIAEDGIPNHLSDKDPLEKESEIGYSNFTVIKNIIKNGEKVIFRPNSILQPKEALISQYSQSN